MNREITIAKRMQNAGLYVFYFSMVLWGLWIIAWLAGLFFNVEILSESQEWWLAISFGILFVAGGYTHDFFSTRVGFLTRLDEGRFDPPTEKEIYAVFFSRIVLMVYIFGSVCIGLLIYSTFPVWDRLKEIDETLRRFVPNGLSTFLEFIAWMVCVVLWGKVGEMLISVTDEDIFRRRRGRLIDALSGLLR